MKIVPAWQEDRQRIPKTISPVWETKIEEIIELYAPPFRASVDEYLASEGDITLLRIFYPTVHQALLGGDVKTVITYLNHPKLQKIFQNHSTRYDLKRLDPEYKNIGHHEIIDFLIRRDFHSDHRWWGEAKFLPIETASAIFLGLLKGGYFKYPQAAVDYVLRNDNRSFDPFFRDEKSFTEIQPYIWKEGGDGRYMFASTYESLHKRGIYLPKMLTVKINSCSPKPDCCPLPPKPEFDCRLLDTSSCS